MQQVHRLILPLTEDIGEGAVGVDGEGAAAREGSEVGGGGAEKI